jgi:hypothetical protein
MTNQEQQLIAAIKALPGHQVFFGTDQASVRVAITKSNSIKQLSVWLGRPSTISNLQQILGA